MTAVDIILKKRNGGELSEEELKFLIQGYVSGRIPDYQLSAFCMAVFFRGMTDEETVVLTREMVNSGDTIDLGGIIGVKADKHSTGGVGDKTSLVLLPMLAACGVKIAKMSGRGLGHTGGTLDKLDSFPGFSSAVDGERFIRQANEVGIVIAGQTARLVPADKKLYALRDVTGTVDSLPLIVSSIMSKKLASGADIIVLDVKTGSGAFMKKESDSFMLAKKMVNIGKACGRKTVGVVSDMDEPLGYAVGNALEVREALAALRGQPCGHLMELCMELGACVLRISGLAESDENARLMLENTIHSGSAMGKLAELVKAQGGDERAVYDESLLPAAPIVLEVKAEGEGFVQSIQAENVGRVCVHLGGGREREDSRVDLAVGIVLKKKVGDYVNKGECLALIHCAERENGDKAVEMLKTCFKIGEIKPESRPFIRGIVE